MITATSTKLAAFIACREALVTTAYQDGPHMSIGFGSNDPSLAPGTVISVADAFTRLKKDIKAREPIVAKAIKVPVNQNQFDAIFDLYYQNGSTGLKGVTSLINEMDPGLLAATYDSISDRTANSIPLDPVTKQFQSYAIDVNGGQTTIKLGLMKRRNMEVDVFWRADYGDLSSILVFDGNPKLVKPTTMEFDYTTFSA